jgi:RNA polymerase sigma-70 factor (ECF subfamily)
MIVFAVMEQSFGDDFGSLARSKVRNVQSHWGSLLTLIDSAGHSAHPNDSSLLIFHNTGRFISWDQRILPRPFLVSRLPGGYKGFMDETVPTTELIRRLRAGDPQAAEDLFVRYSHRLIRLAEQHLSPKLAARLDGEDVVQSVFRTFFRRNARGEFQLDSSAQLWRLLVTITLRKTQAKGRIHTRGPRNVGAEAAGGDLWLAEALANEPGPEEAVVLTDLIASLLHGLSDLHGQVLELRLQGYSAAEIAPKLQISRRTVYRMLDLFQERLHNSDTPK